jgi:large subunit ribosomal protein L15
MVVRRRKKVRKMRGSKTHGYGEKKKHRGKGSRGGKGFAGSKDHKRQMVLQLDPDHFGKRGFKRGFYPHIKRKREEEKVITLRELDKLAEKLNTLELDLTKLGFKKVIAGGYVTKPISIKVERITDRAREKIESVGGKVEIVGGAA